MTGSAGPLPDHDVHFHDAECGAYRADLPLWEELCADARAPVELGAGTGRVSLHLAAVGLRPLAVERDTALLEALLERARERGLVVEGLPIDARGLDLGEKADVIIAPMQLVQLMGDAADRERLLAAAARSLAPGGLLALTLLDEGEGLAGGPAAVLLPDVREADGWIHSSLPLRTEVSPKSVEVVRLRQLVSPDGVLSEDEHVIRLERVSPSALLAEGGRHGFAERDVRALPATDDHVGSIAVTMQRR